MPILIDGHNLIGKLPDIDLADPDDEFRLVLKLRTYCARTGKRVTVVFDEGLPGGRLNEWSTGGVTTVFASPGRSADGILCERIRKSKNPGGLIVVTSDQKVISGAQARGARVIRSEDFDGDLAGASPEASGYDSKPPLGEVDLDYWLSQFGQERSGPRRP